MDQATHDIIEAIREVNNSIGFLTAIFVMNALLNAGTLLVFIIH